MGTTASIASSPSLLLFRLSNRRLASSLETTQVYTHVTISKLKAVYEACHPGAKPVAEAKPASVGDGDEGHYDGENGRDELQE